MTTRTRAATAAATHDHTHLDDPDRRAMLASASAAAVLAAIGTSAEAAPVNIDAGLFDLRAQWLAARRAYEAAGIPRTPDYAAELAALPAVPAWRGDNLIARQNAVRARAEALTVLRRAEPLGILASDAEDLQEAALDEECRVVGMIAATPARTLLGLAFKGEVSTYEEHLNSAMLASIMADIDAFAAVQSKSRAA